MFHILVMDSQFHPTSGLMEGNMFWPGAFDQCGEIEVKAHAFKTKYCLSYIVSKHLPKISVSLFC